MPNRTFAFSHRGGYWKTRYSFFSNCYAFINKALLSFRVTMQDSQQNPVWRHNVGGYANFYDQTVKPSIAVTFNQNPSQNKIFKSVSVEGTNNSMDISDIKLNSFMIANNSTVADQRKQSAIISFEDKGGILYGHIQGQATNTNGNVRYMGMLDLTSDDALAAIQGDNLILRGPFTWADGGESNVSALSAKYVFGLPNGQVTNDVDTPVDLTNTYADVPSDIKFQGYNPQTRLATFVVTGGAAVLPSLQELGQVPIYSITNNEIYGDMLKGQYADAVFLFSSEDWEVLSLNLEYEPTTYDHSSNARMPSIGRGNRRRRR